MYYDFLCIPRMLRVAMTRRKEAREFPLEPSVSVCPEFREEGDSHGKFVPRKLQPSLSSPEPQNSQELETRSKKATGIKILLFPCLRTTFAPEILAWGYDFPLICNDDHVSVAAVGY